MLNFREISQAWDKQRADWWTSAQVEEWIKNTWEEITATLNKSKLIVLPVDRRMTIKEWLKILMDCHDKTEEDILKEFNVIRNFRNVTVYVKFDTLGKNIEIYWYNKDWYLIWQDLMNWITGNPEPKHYS